MFTVFLIVLAVVAFASILKREKKLPISITTPEGVILKGANLMAVINVNQKVKLTALPDGSVDPSTFAFEVVGLPNVTVVAERVDGELAVYAVATEVLGDSDVTLLVTSTDGTVLKDHVVITVVEAPVAPAANIVIVVGVPEPK